jgi:hypothetical protein
MNEIKGMKIIKWRERNEWNEREERNGTNRTK